MKRILVLVAIIVTCSTSKAQQPKNFEEPLLLGFVRVELPFELQGGSGVSSDTARYLPVHDSDPRCTYQGQLYFKRTSSTTGTPRYCTAKGNPGTWNDFGSGGGGSGDALTTDPLSQFASTTSAQLAGVLSDETGSGGGFVRATSPTLTTPNLGAPSAVTLTNGTGLPITTGVSGLGSNVATFLATPSSANLASAVTGETGSGALVFGTSPDFTTGITIGSVAVPTISSTNTFTNKTIAFGSNAVSGTIAQFNTAVTDDDLMTLGGSETVTGAKTYGSALLLTTRPRVTTSIDDANGNEVIKTPATSSAVNEITVTNSATGNAVSITATGGDTDIDLVLAGKGAGKIVVGDPGATTSYIDAIASAPPSTPSSGIATIYVDSTSKNIAVKDDAGVVKHGVQTATCTNGVGAISDAGAVTCTTTFTNPAVTAQTLTDGATINWDTNSGAVASVTLGGNHTMAAPTNLKTGGSYWLSVIQDGTGSRTITWNSAFKWPGGTAPTLTTTASRKDLITCASFDGSTLQCNALLDVR